MFTRKQALSPVEAAQFNPVALAFLGDAVYSLYVREKLLISQSVQKTAVLQKAAARVVSASGQSQALETIFDAFTEEESEVFRRGKNAKKSTKSKSASSSEYNRSTGFEAVLGYLYLTGQDERISQLLDMLPEENFKVEEDVKPFKPKG